MPSLSTYNAVAAGLHGFLALFFYFYFAYINNKHPNDPVQGIELSQRDHTLSFQDVSGNTVLIWSSTQTSNPSVRTVQNMLVAFFAITALFHLFYYLSRDGLYESLIENHNNYLRWIEYSITSTLMLYSIAMLCGVKDTNLYLMLGAVNVVMVAQGQIIETAVRDGSSWWVPMVSSFVLLIAQFVIIMRDYFNRLNAARAYSESHPNATKQRVPAWLTFMVIVLFIFFSCFGFVNLYSAYKGDALEYETTEKMYLILSFLAKASLGLFLAIGINQRQISASPSPTPTPTPTPRP
jgi:hypothetical protein